MNDEIFLLIDSSDSDIGTIICCAFTSKDEAAKVQERSVWGTDLDIVSVSLYASAEEAMASGDWLLFSKVRGIQPPQTPSTNN